MWCWITDHHHCQCVKLTWTITHCLGLGHETMMSAVCLSIFLLFSIACIYIQCCNYYRGLWNHNRHPIPHPHWWAMRSVLKVLKNIDHTLSGSNEMFLPTHTRMREFVWYVSYSFSISNCISYPIFSIYQRAILSHVISCVLLADHDGFLSRRFPSIKGSW